VVGGFRLLRHVATGSYGSVWQVESVEYPGCLFALKFSLHAPEDGTPGDARAEREVQLLLRAAHENVVRVVSHGRWPHPHKGPHYLVMEWVEGGTLRQWAHGVRPSARQAVRVCQKLSRALQRAHEAGVVHRDVKPDNVLIRLVDDEPFLCDFGVGGALGAPSLTLGAFPPGTLCFHSPQLLKSRLPGGAWYRAQPADDWYALGVLLYQLLTEVPPYPEFSEVHEMASWVLRYKPVAPHELNPRVPPALGQVALTLLSAEPHLRYPDGHAVCAALEQALATAAQPEAPLLPPLPPPDRVPTQPPSESDGPLAQDERVLNAHAARDEVDPEEERLEQLENQRDMLLRTWRQRRPLLLWRQAAQVAGQPWARGVAAAALLGGLAVGAWALWPRPAVAPAAPPVLTAAAPQSPQVPPPVAASPASPHLAPLDASPPKEGSPVKTPPSPVSPPSTPAADRHKATKSSAAKTAVCVGILTSTGCASVPVRPTQQQCPPAAMQAMQQREWKKFGVDLNPNSTRANEAVTLRPGPIISTARDLDAPESGGWLLHGHVYFAEDGRIVVRYTEVELEGGARVPICFAIVPGDGKRFDVEEVFNRTEESVQAPNSQVAIRVRVLPD
jgi:serine/threonine-protein kinase